MSTERILQLKSNVEKAGKVDRHITFKVFIDDFVKLNLLDLNEKNEFDELFAEYSVVCYMYEGYHNGTIPDIDMIVHLSAEKIKNMLFSTADTAQTITVWKFLYNCRKNGRVLWITVNDIVTKLCDKIQDETKFIFDELFWHLGGCEVDIVGKLNYYARIFGQIITQKITLQTMRFLQILTKWFLSDVRFSGLLADDVWAFRLKNVSLKLFKIYEKPGSRELYGNNPVNYIRTTIQLFAYAGVVPDIPCVVAQLRFEVFFDVRVFYVPETDTFYRAQLIQPGSNKCMIQILNLDGYSIVENMSYWDGTVTSFDFQSKLRLFN